jgi:mono/diheme cytochrome c family protein
MGRALLALLGAALLVTSAVGCQYSDPQPFTEPFWVVGGEIDPDTLNRGMESYTLYCYACHGWHGDGNGPASFALRPPPRDFRTGLFKFAAAAEGDGQPHDEELHRVVKHGLNGTAMLPWDIPPRALDDIIQYIKTFSRDGEGFRDPDSELAPKFVFTEDPWKGKEDAAVQMGQNVYHGKAKCWTCHASFESPDAIVAAGKLYKQDIQDIPAADVLFESKLQDSKYTTRIRHPVYTLKDGVPCKTDADCDTDKKQVCDQSYAVQMIGPRVFQDHDGVNGRCIHKVRLLPPDFTINTVRSYRPPTPEEQAEGVDLDRGRKDLYRTLANGLAGTAMNGWRGVLTDDEIWAAAYYVESLIQQKDSVPAWEAKRRLKAAASK